MRQYLRLYFFLLRFALTKVLHFRFDFIFRFFMDLAFCLISLFFYELLFQNSETLGDFSVHEARIFVGAYLVADATHMTFFATNLWLLPRMVNRGDLDYYLLRPISPAFFLLLREFSASSCLNLLVALGVLTYAISSYPGDLFSGYGSLLFPLLLANGIMLYVLIRVLLILPVFWLHSMRSSDYLFFLLAEFAERPDRLYQGVMRVVFLFIVPMGLVASVPTRILCGKAAPGEAALALLIGGIFLASAVFLWRRGLKAYSSASA